MLIALVLTLIIDFIDHNVAHQFPNVTVPFSKVDLRVMYTKEVRLSNNSPMQFVLLDMRNILILLLLVSTELAYSQDSCEVNVKNEYSELTQPITEFFHENGQLSHRYITKNEKTTKVVEWDSCGNRLRKTKSRKTVSKKGPCTKMRKTTYYANGQVKSKSSSKMCGCFKFKRSRRKEYSEDGKRI